MLPLHLLSPSHLPPGLSAGLVDRPTQVLGEVEAVEDQRGRRHEPVDRIDVDCSHVAAHHRTGASPAVAQPGKEACHGLRSAIPADPADPLPYQVIGHGERLLVLPAAHLVDPEPVQGLPRTDGAGPRGPRLWICRTVSPHCTVQGALPQPLDADEYPLGCVFDVRHIVGFHLELFLVHVSMRIGPGPPLSSVMTGVG